MGAAISVRDFGRGRSAATLLGTFDKSNRWFLVKHLRELDGDVVIDLQHVTGLDASSMEALEAFCHSAASQLRRVVFRSLPARIPSRPRRRHTSA